MCGSTAPSWQGGPLRAPVASPRFLALLRYPVSSGPDQRHGEHPALPTPHRPKRSAVLCTCSAHGRRRCGPISPSSGVGCSHGHSVARSTPPDNAVGQQQEYRAGDASAPYSARYGPSLSDTPQGLAWQSRYRSAQISHGYIRARLLLACAWVRKRPTPEISLGLLVA